MPGWGGSPGTQPKDHSMRAIIEGKRYDTQTAEEVAHYWNGLGPSDFKNVSETLYRTKRGNWFLSGEGGPMTRYAQPVGNNGRSGGSAIIPLEPSEALAWLESKHRTDEIEQYFSDQVEDA